MSTEEIVKLATYHTPVKSQSGAHFMSSTLDLMLPVPGGKKMVQLRRIIQAEPGNQQNNEQASAVRYFINLLNFIERGHADQFEEEVFADDDESFAIAIGKTTFAIDKAKIAPPRLAEEVLNTYVDMRAEQ